MGPEAKGRIPRLSGATESEVRAACLDFGPGEARAVLILWGLYAIWLASFVLMFAWVGFFFVAIADTVASILLAWGLTMAVCDRVSSDGSPAEAARVSHGRVTHMLFGSPWPPSSPRAAWSRIRR